MDVSQIAFDLVAIKKNIKLPFEVNKWWEKNIDRYELIIWGDGKKNIDRYGANWHKQTDCWMKLWWWGGERSCFLDLVI